MLLGQRNTFSYTTIKTDVLTLFWEVPMPLIEPPGLPDFIASLLPFERKAYELEKGNFAGHLIHFLDHGSRTGQVVLMLHGNPTWSFLWRKVITALDPDQFRCVAPDLLGLGCSSKPRETTAHHHSDPWQLQVRTCRVENPGHGGTHSGNLSGTDGTRRLYPAPDRQLLRQAEAAKEYFSQPGKD